MVLFSSGCSYLSHLCLPPQCPWHCRYRGRHIHGFAQLKMNRLSKRPCFPNRALDALRKGCSSQPPRFYKHKKCHPPQSKMQGKYLEYLCENWCDFSDMMRNLARLSMWGKKNWSKNLSNLFSIENYVHQQKDTSYSTSDKLCRRKKEVKNNSGISSRTESLNHVKQKDKVDKKVGIVP